ncbi:VOC family protein [Pelagibius sp. Alg239-R121]|uniref:VOC family protein n=1 Tax=Pelagibius sp. Alg239-R121 TaxID=2993448 RepID=UPI0024A6E04F|nr:VOC family protein [Pelagibius sp. Alg239-R121]
MATGRSIDHIVVAVRDLDAAAKVYEELGFTLTPRAMHEDRMGTSNRLAQFAGKNFIEILEVDRPDTLVPHDPSKTPPFFSFGGHNKERIAEREGMSMLVFASGDARADAARFQAASVPTYEVFDFDRQARLPGGEQVTVSFSLTFATSPDMPDLAFFVCQNRAQEYFWKPEFQKHKNAARVITAVYIASSNPERDSAFVSKMFGGAVSAITGGFSVACGAGQEVRVVTPESALEHDPSLQIDLSSGPAFVGIALASGETRETTPATAACGLFIEWIAV